MTVSNHISYLDVLLVAAQTPSIFVTSTEVGSQPGLGLLCRLAGCVFVNRRSASALRKEIAELARLMSQGFHIVVFPESTSTRGTEVMPFKPALFEALRVSGATLWMARVSYPPAQIQEISYAGDDLFLPHLARLVGLREIRASWHWIETRIDTTSVTARGLARDAWTVVSGSPIEPQKPLYEGASATAHYA